jgi:hypothetical protein
MSFPDAQLQNIKVGNDAGYLLEFFGLSPAGTLKPMADLSVSSEAHYASIEASLPSGLQGGRYIITIEGLNDDDFAKLAPGNPERALACRLYMFWREVNQSVLGYLGNLAGLTGGLSEENKPDALVAELQILRVERRAGNRRYETKISAVERVMYQLRFTPTPQQVEPVRSYHEAIEHLTSSAHVEVDEYLDRVPPPSGATDGADVFTFQSGKSCAMNMVKIADRLEQATGKRGRGMLLIRDGKLIVGPRPIPMGVELPPKDLMPSNGLVDTQLTSTEASDPFAQLNESGAATTAAPPRPRYSLTLKGRPDLKPGDLVRFDLSPLNEGKTIPTLGAALLGAFAGSFLGGETMENPKIAYVEAVEHKMSRTHGFVTKVTGVGAASASESDLWDIHTEAAGSDSPSPGPVSADPAVQAAAAVRRLAETSTRRSGLEVGEVRGFVANSAQEPTTQTELLWCGLRGADGRPNQVRRLPVSRELPAVKEGVTYLSPFAWGKCGLIIPRYPGIRVAVGFRNGNPDDPLELGALWETGTTTTQAQAGDWWLSLPAKVPANQRTSIDANTVPSAYTDVVSNDLIDADGNRVIEVGELTIRVNELGALTSAGTRPTQTTDTGSITIEHAKNQAKIVIKPDGSISIVGKQITIDAGDGNLELKAKNINMTAQIVDVSAGTEMNVH